MNAIAPRPVALITGAGKRIGAGIARRLHAAGYDLALHYRRSAQQASALVDTLEPMRPGSTLLLQAELGDTERLAQLPEMVLARYGRLDALVNNASSFFATPLGLTTAAQWDELFIANARGPFFLSQAATPALRQAQGAIVNLIDIYAEWPLAGHAVYGMAKAALAAMTRALALELAPEVRVNGIAPGAILWPEQGKSPQAQQAMLERTPLRRCGTPEDVASAVLWLLRDAPFMTGQILRLDGGRTLML